MSQVDPSPVARRPLTGVSHGSQSLERARDVEISDAKKNMNRTFDYASPGTGYCPEPDHGWHIFGRARHAHFKNAENAMPNKPRPKVPNFLNESAGCVSDQNSSIRKKYEARYGLRCIDRGIYDNIEPKVTWRPSTSQNTPNKNHDSGKENFVGKRSDSLSQRSEKLECLAIPDKRFQGGLRNDTTGRGPGKLILDLDKRNGKRPATMDNLKGKR